MTTLEFSYVAGDWVETGETTLRSETPLMPLARLSSRLSFYVVKGSGCERCCCVTLYFFLSVIISNMTTRTIYRQLERADLVAERWVYKCDISQSQQDLVWASNQSNLMDPLP